MRTKNQLKQLRNNRKKQERTWRDQATRANTRLRKDLKRVLIEQQGATHRMLAHQYNLKRREAALVIERMIAQAAEAQNNEVAPVVEAVAVS
jgi:hypothetical protein